jgi:hypothetical protein
LPKQASFSYSSLCLRNVPLLSPSPDTRHDTCQRKLSPSSSDTGLFVSPSPWYPHECKFVYVVFYFVFIFPAH